MPSLNDYLNQDLTRRDFQHTSGYVGSDGMGGGGGGLSMEKRRQLLNQPRVVGAYHQSRLGQQYAAGKARTAGATGKRIYDASTGRFKDESAVGYGKNRQSNTVKPDSKVQASIEKRQHFIEPSSRPSPRGYNPYA